MVAVTGEAATVFPIGSCDGCPRSILAVHWSSVFCQRTSENSGLLRCLNESKNFTCLLLINSGTVGTFNSVLCCPVLRSDFLVLTGSVCRLAFIKPALDIKCTCLRGPYMDQHYIRKFSFLCKIFYISW